MEDECGVAYTKDWESLFEGTKVIGEEAFYKCFLSADLSRKEKTNFINKKSVTLKIYQGDAFLFSAINYVLI